MLINQVGMSPYIFVALFALILQAVVLVLGLEEAASSPAKGRVRIGVYFESLCPDSKRFFVDQLVPTSEHLGDLFEAKLVPFGHARVIGNNKMVCQHGQRECDGNRRMACILSRSSNQTQVIQTFGCMLTSPNDWKSCIKNFIPSLEGSLDSIDACSKAEESYKIMTEAEKETGRVGYVPHLTLNGKSDSGIQRQLEETLEETICAQYEPAPEACKRAS